MAYTRLVDGTTGSNSQILKAFSELLTQGQAAIKQLVTIREDTLLLFNNALSELNGKRVTINRLPEIGIAAKFVTTDLQDINQAITTASLRADSNGFSLRERAAPGEAIVSQVRFSASEGTIQALQVPQANTTGNLGALYRVATANGNIPTGTFDVMLLSSVGISLVIFDMMNTPSTAQIQVMISQNGINFIPALNVTRNGYRLAARFQPQEIKFIRIVITPTLPDILGGTVFTFGLTDIHVLSVQYHLRSDAYTNQIVFTPRSANVRFSTPSIPGLLYFLSLAGNPPIEVFPDSIVSIPGTATHIQTSVSLIAPTGSVWVANTAYILGNQIIDSNGNLQIVTAVSGSGTSGAVHPVWSIIGGTTIDNPGGNQLTWTETAWSLLNFTLPVNTYLSTLSIVDHITQVEIRIAPGLSKLTTGIVNQYVVVNNDHTMDLIIYNHAVDQTRTFDISYITGPATVTASLQVELVTTDLNTSPIYSGATLVEV